MTRLSAVPAALCFAGVWSCYAQPATVCNVSNAQTNGYVLTATTTGGNNCAWRAGGGVPGGSNTQVQFNDGGVFGGSSGFTFDKTTGNVAIGTTVLGSDGSVKAPAVLTAADQIMASGASTTGVASGVGLSNCPTGALQYSTSTHTFGCGTFATLGANTFNGTITLSNSAGTGAGILTSISGQNLNLNSPGAYTVFGNAITAHAGADFGAGNMRMDTILTGGTNFNADFSVTTPGAGVVKFAVANTEAVRIANSGNLLIGGATDGNYRADIQKSGSSGTFRVYDQTATTGATRVLFDLGAADSATTNIFTVSGKMTASGGIVLPTSCTGLSSGVLYNNAGTPAICP